MKNKIKELIQNFIDSTTNIATLNSRTLFVRENIEIIKDLTSYLSEDSKINERLYIIYNDLDENDIKCPMCDNKRKFYTFTSGYNICCSQSCASKYQQTHLITKEQKVIIYAKRTENNRNKPDEVKQAEVDKRLNTTKERYGENAFSEISKKAHQTKIKNGTYIAPFTLLKVNNPKLWTDMHFRAAQTMKNDIDENGNNHYDRVHLMKLNDIDENGNNFYDRWVINNYESGIWVKPEDKDDLSHYRVKVAKVMYKYKDDIKKLDNFEKRGHANKGMYHLDHKFSVIEGFKQNIPPYIIGHINNLEMLIGRNNLVKNRKCSIDKDVLIDSILGNSETSIN